MKTVALLVLTVSLFGCSPTAAIARHGNDIAERSGQDIEAWDRVEKLHADLAGESKAGKARARATINDTREISTLLTGVEDETPWWASLLGWLAIAAIVIGLIVILFQTGLGSFIRVAIGWIPRPKVSTAELAVDMLDPNKPESDRELIAALRQDREFDAAYKRAAARRKA